MNHHDVPSEITASELKQWLDNGHDIDLIDVREPWEHELCLIPGSQTIPLGQVPDRIDEISREKIGVFICHHGGRSARAIAWLKNNGFEKLVNLQGGIDNWALDVDNSMARY